MDESVKGTEREVAWDHGGPAPGDGRSPKIDTSTTVNPFPSNDLMTLLKRSMGKARHYPDPYSEGPRSALAKRFSLNPSGIVTGGGATVLLYTLIREGGFRRLLLFDPVFSEYEKAARRTGIPVLRIPPTVCLKFRDDRGAREMPDLRWGIDPDSVAGVSPGPGDLAVIVNPVNPTGQEFSRNQIRTLSERMAMAGGSLLVDESFQDFICNRSSFLEWSGENGATVLRSLTKISGLPGIRTGFLAGRAGLMERIGSALGPWCTGIVEQTLMDWSAKQTGPANFGWREGAKSQLESDLARSGIPYLPGSGPFVFAAPGWTDTEGEVARTALLERGVRIRLGGGFGPKNGEMFVRLGFEAFHRGDDLIRALLSFSKSREPGRPVGVRDERP